MPDTVEEMSPEIPRLDKLLRDVNDVSESGARYSDMPQVGVLKNVHAEASLVGSDTVQDDGSRNVIFVLVLKQY